MSFGEFVMMIEEGVQWIYVVEYCDGDDKLVVAVFIDVFKDGVLLIYSFFDLEECQCSFGSYMILDVICQVVVFGLFYVYLGYWVLGSVKMEYKVKFQFLQVLMFVGWMGFDMFDIDEDIDFNG